MLSALSYDGEIISDAFLAMMCAEPDADGPRRVYADWLEERGERTWPTILGHVLAHPAEDWPRWLAADWCEREGQPERAEFIRAQMEISRMGSDCEVIVAGCRCMGCRHLRAMAQGELACRGNSWFCVGDLSVGFAEKNLVLYRPGNAAFEAWPRRGFLEQVRGSWADWAHYADALTAAQPIREVALTTLPELKTESRDGHFGRHIRCTLQAGNCVAQMDLPEEEPQSPHVDYGLIGLLWPNIQFVLPEAVPTTLENIRRYFAELDPQRTAEPRTVRR